MSTAIIIGLSIAATGFGMRALLLGYKNMQALSKLTGTSAFTHYYKGGFEQQMSRREACLILGIREFDGNDKLRDAHRRIMMANHPDKGGSPYLATKINEAKTLLDSRK